MRNGSRSRKHSESQLGMQMHLVYLHISHLTDIDDAQWIEGSGFLVQSIISLLFSLLQL